MKISDLQKKTDKWIQDYGVRYFDPMTNTALLMEEVGELARLMARKYGEQSSKTEISQEGIADEMSDILFVLTCLANQMNIDLTDALATNFQKKTERDGSRHLNNPKLKAKK